MPAHTHDVTDYYGINPYYGYGAGYGGPPNLTTVDYQSDNTATAGSGSTHTHTTSFTGDTNQEKRPPFYTLAAIQKS
jgi:hypothetical protein